MKNSSLHQAATALQRKYNTLYQRLSKTLAQGNLEGKRLTTQSTRLQRLQRYERRLQHWGIAVASTAALFLAPPAVFAQPTLVGIEFQVNTYTTRDQTNPSVAMDSDGDFVVVWQSGSYSRGGQDGEGFGIYGRRYNSSGVAQGIEFQVNTYTTNKQSYPSVAMNSDGDFVVIWQSDGQDGDRYGIYGQRYNSSGVAQGIEFKVNTYTTDFQVNPSVAMDSDGDFVVTWQSTGQDGSVFGIYGQRYNSSGVAQGIEFQVNTYTANRQAIPSVAMDSDGDFVVTWQSDDQDGSGYDIYGQRYNSSGLVQGSEFQINTYTTSVQILSSVAMDSNGDFVVTWASYGQDGDRNGIYGQRYHNSGVAQGSEFKVNAYTTSFQVKPSVAMDSDGDFMVTWQNRYRDGSGEGIYGQRYNSSGVAQGIEFKVNTYTTNNQADPSVAMDSDGDFMVTWRSLGQDGSSYGIYGQRYQKPCAAAAGLLANSASASSINLCQGTDDGLTFSASAASSSNEYAFLLADGSGNILQNTADGDFDLSTLSVGTYTVYGLSYDVSNTPDNITDYLVGKTIADIETDDASASVCLELSQTPVLGQSNNIIIKPIPVITQQPVDQAVCDTEEATFEVEATGDDLTYQWQQDGNDLSGAANSSLTTDQAGDYNVLITEDGCTISSDTVSLIANNASATIPDINSLVFDFCTRPFTASFDPIAGAVAYVGEVTVTIRQNQVITRLVPMSPVNGTFKIPRRIIGSVVTVRLAAVFVDPITNQQVFGEFSCPKDFLVACGSSVTGRGESSLTGELAAEVFPNPADGLLNLDYFSTLSANGQVQVLDATGKVVMNFPVATLEGDNTLPIDISQLQVGLYALKLVVATETVVVPFVKQ